MMRSPPCADQQRVAQERIARQHERIGVDLADLGDAHALVAVVREHPREAAASGKPEASATPPVDFCVNWPM